MEFTGEQWILDAFKLLVESATSVNTRNQLIEACLHFAVQHRWVATFNYFLSLDGINVNCLDRQGRSPLVYLASRNCYEYFAEELIKKGANLHLTDDAGYTFLHFAAQEPHDNALMVGQMAIEKGADLNAQTHLGLTPLNIACENGNFRWICMLLSYGADGTIHEYQEFSLYSSLSMDMPSDQKIQWEQILFNYVFDCDNLTVQLPTLVWAMSFQSSLFAKIMENISVVRYDTSDIENFQKNLIYLTAENFKLFAEKFGDIVKKMINGFPLLVMLLDVDSHYWHVHKWKGLFDAILESEHASDFVQGAEPQQSTIACLVSALNAHISLEEITNMVSLMLSYGLNVTSVDLDLIYNHYGYCELFRMLLHMDIEIIDDNSYDIFYFNSIIEHVEKCALSPLYYNFNINVESYFQNIRSYTKCHCLLNYYNHPKLNKKLCHETDGEIIAKVKKMTRVPLLVELSRNASRKYIVNRYRIKNSMQFYTVLKWLPIGTMNKHVISLETKLY